MDENTSISEQSHEPASEDTDIVTSDDVTKDSKDATLSNHLLDDPQAIAELEKILSESNGELDSTANNELYASVKEINTNLQYMTVSSLVSTVGIGILIGVVLAIAFGRLFRV